MGQETRYNEPISLIEVPLYRILKWKTILKRNSYCQNCFPGWKFQVLQSFNETLRELVVSRQTLSQH